MSNYDPQVTQICNSNTISDYLRDRGHILVRAGRRIKCKCPLPSHSTDNTPSFNINTFEDGTEYFKCFGCLPGHQEVLTDNGMRMASDIRLGDVVFDHLGDQATVVAVHKHSCRNPILRMTTSVDKAGFYGTADHDMLWLQKPNRQGGVISSLRKSDRIYEVELRHISKKMWVPIAIPKASHSNGKVMLYLDKRSKKRYVEFTITSEFAWMCGLFCAEGSVSGGRLIAFDVHEKEAKGFASRIEYALRSVGIPALVVVQPIRVKPKEKNKKQHGQTITVCCAGLARWLTEECGRGCANKRMPRVVRSSRLDTQAAWFVGVYGGDGSKNSRYLSVTSKYLTSDAFRVALMCGGIPVMHKTTFPQKKKPIHNVSFRQDSIQIISRIAAGGEFIPKLTKYACHVRIDGNWILAARVEDVRVVRHKPSEVYDIEVSGRKTYSCLTVAVHNCGKSGNIITLVAEMERIKKRDVIQKLAKKSGIRLSRIDAGAKIEPLPTDILTKFCEEDLFSMRISKLAHQFMDINEASEDSVDKMTRVFEMTTELVAVGDMHGLHALHEKLARTLFRYRSGEIDNPSTF